MNYPYYHSLRSFFSYQALPLGGFFCQTIGWEYIFYIFGSIGIAWFILWWLCASASPSDHGFISEKERDYIIKETNSNSNEKEVY